MAMSGIDATQGLAAMLRQRMTALRAAGEPRAAGSASSPASPASPSGTSQTARPADLRSIVAPRILALSPEDPERRRKALRIYLECSLLRGLGLDLADDPRFTEMVEAVQAQMEADKAFAATADRLVDALLSP